MKAFADDKRDVVKMTISHLDSVKSTGKRRKCWLPAFSRFPTEFSKAFFLPVAKSRDCYGKELTTILNKVLCLFLQDLKNLTATQILKRRFLTKFFVFFFKI